MGTIHQYDQRFNNVHQHSFTPSAGNITDLTSVGNGIFYVGNDSGTIDVVRIAGQAQVVESGGPSGVAAIEGISYIGNNRHLIAFRTGVNRQFGVMNGTTFANISTSGLMGS